VAAANAGKAAGKREKKGARCEQPAAMREWESSHTPQRVFSSPQPGPSQAEESWGKRCRYPQHHH